MNAVNSIIFIYDMEEYEVRYKDFYNARIMQAATNWKGYDCKKELILSIKL